MKTLINLICNNVMFTVAIVNLSFIVDHHLGIVVSLVVYAICYARRAYWI